MITLIIFGLCIVTYHTVYYISYMNNIHWPRPILLLQIVSKDAVEWCTTKIVECFIFVFICTYIHKTIRQNYLTKNDEHLKYFAFIRCYCPFSSILFIHNWNAKTSFFYYTLLLLPFMLNLFTTIKQHNIHSSLFL